MARPAVEVRDAGAGDIDVLMGLYASARFDQGQLRTATATVRARLLRALEHGEVQVLLASLGAQPAGYALITTSPLLPLGSSAGPSIEHLHVVPHLRRRGVGRALLRRALLLAQADGADQIACTVLPGDRDYTRYLARLGFAPVVVRRAVPLPVLRRRLAEGPPALAHTTDVVARRRSLRARLARAGAPGPGSPPAGVPTAS
ncbi:GNAT superfamily N-acetyltransferase [Kineococcus radiotolerans]|uniref:GNAT superfamily N-acetyltransferase n=1 Tax=Kineococcus radiotolerans TaxID=131568 RepID=A0A7W4XZ35_KINRA|nr:GNAT family N-acetyltransferase [Kineococcus radiotolerans]MBB2902910.1 GNAT superfamily N-acetyltransferase [Kineococcus radiotolerans]